MITILNIKAPPAVKAEGAYFFDDFAKGQFRYGKLNPSTN